MEKAVAILFANLKGNLGDLAILEANLLRLAQVYPDHRIDVWSSGFLTVDQVRLGSFIKAGAPPFRLRGTSPDHPLRRWRSAARSFGLERALQPYLVARSQRRFATDAEGFAEYERIFVVGGDQFDANASAAMFGTLKAVAGINPRLSNFPLSVNPRTQNINSPSLLRDFFALFEGPVLVRDELSNSFLKGIGVAAELGADSVLSLSSRIKAISGSDSSAGLVVALTRSAPEDSAELARLLGRLAPLPSAIRTLTSTPSVDKAFLDRRAMNVAYSAPGTWQELVAELRSATLVVSNRFHCVLLAAMVGTPVLPVCNRTKIRSIKTAAGLPFSVEGIHAVTPSMIQTVLDFAPRQREAFDRYLEMAATRKTSPI